ncbi:MAG: DUF262 domain-containing protein [Rhodospirillales bacterium]|nr:DUF262 domain-containing protein [Rhodospirillales bacterium]
MATEVRDAVPEKENDDLDFKKEEDDELHVEYDIANYPSDYTLSVIHEMWKNDDIEIPEFQRNFVWTIKQSSLLIESFLKGLPVPQLFFYIDDQHKNLVIDGQQRVMSIVYFLEGYFGPENQTGRRQVFRLTGLDETSPYHRKTFADLSESLQRKFKSRVLRVVNIRQMKPEGKNTSMFHIFERLNTGGTPLRPQEIRNCVFSGDIVDRLKELNEDKNWRNVIGKANIDKHQRDVEMVLRVLALADGHMNYQKPMKEFLNKYMDSNRNGTSKEFRKLHKDFLCVTEILDEHGGKRVFHVHGPINRAAMDCIFASMLIHLDRREDWSKLSSQIEQLYKNEEFRSCIFSNTSDPNIVKKRMEIALECIGAE